MTGTPQPPSPTTMPFRTATASPTSTPLPSGLLMQENVGDARDMEWSPAGDVIAVTNEQGVTLFDATDLSVNDRLEIEGGGDMLSFSPAGDYLAVLDQLGDELFMIQLSGEVQVVTTTPSFNCIYESIKFGIGRILIEAVYCPPDDLSIGGITHLLDEGPPLALINDYEFQAQPIAISPQGDRAALGLFGPGLEIYGVSGYGPGYDEPLMSISGANSSVYEMVFTPSGEHLVTIGSPCTFRLLDAADGRLVRSFGWCEKSPPSVKEFGLDVSENGERGAAVDSERSFGVWHLETGTHRDSFPIPMRKRNSLSFSPDGSKIASVGEDGLLQIWAIDG